MKKIFLTMVITMLVMLVIGNGLALVYLGYKCDKSSQDIERLKYALASTGVDVEGIKYDEKVTTLEDNETPKAAVVEGTKEAIEDNEEYQKYIDMGIKNIDKIANELPSYYAIKALEDITDCDIETVAEVEWNDDEEVINSESKKVWNSIVSDLAEDICDILNSDDDIDTKLEKIEVYGDLAYPVLDNVNEYLKDGESIKYSNCKITCEFSLKEKNKIKEFVDEADLSDKEMDTVSDYIEYMSE